MRSLNTLMDLSGRKALVTGAAGHIGSAISETLAEMGATVGVWDRDPEACEKSAAALGRIRKGAALSLPCDLSDEGAVRKHVQKAIADLKGLDILVHCAGYVGTSKVPGWAVPFEKQTVEAWDAAMRVNLTAAMLLAQEAKDTLSASGHGSVIFVSSIYGLVAPDFRLYESTDMANPAGYCASKGGLLQLMRYLSTLLAPRVRVNAVSPGGIWRNQPKAFLEKYQNRTPLARMGTEEDLKGAVAYLASDLSAYVSGQNLIVDGGWTAW
jgi:NAD(P)-dependent dehydrogenase (short-subunit alcohol dehydrogenase family)